MRGRRACIRGGSGRAGGTAAPKAGATGLPPSPVRILHAASGSTVAHGFRCKRKKRGRGGVAGGTTALIQPTSCKATRMARGKERKRAGQQGGRCEGRWAQPQRPGPGPLVGPPPPRHVAEQSRTRPGARGEKGGGRWRVARPLKKKGRGWPKGGTNGRAHPCQVSFVQVERRGLRPSSGMGGGVREACEKERKRCTCGQQPCPDGWLAGPKRQHEVGQPLALRRSMARGFLGMQEAASHSSSYSMP